MCFVEQTKLQRNSSECKTRTDEFRQQGVELNTFPLRGYSYIIPRPTASTHVGHVPRANHIIT